MNDEVGFEEMLLWVLFALMLAMMCSCVYAPTPYRHTLTYRCALDKERCELLRSAASVATSEGFPTIEAPDGISFGIGSAQSIFAGQCDGGRLNGQQMPVLCAPPALYSRYGAWFVNVIPGPVMRRSDFVSLVVDQVFERER